MGGGSGPDPAGGALDANGEFQQTDSKYEETRPATGDGRGVPPGMPAGGEAPAGEGRLRSRSSYPEERPEGRGRAEGKDALGPDQGTIKYIIRSSYYDGADRP